MNPQTFWQKRGILNILLLPLSFVFAVISHCRRLILTALRQPAASLPPIIIIGNIVAGGSGKTPIVIALANQLATRGWKPGIISRGYGGNYQSDTLMLDKHTDWQQCGDEPLLIHHRTNLPVCVAKKRRLAAKRLTQAGCNILISDDGLQHYTLPRTIEICISNADYRTGNGWRLPAGPLRESPQRIQQCDFHILVGTQTSEDDKTIHVEKTIQGIYALHQPHILHNAGFFADKTVTAAAGIAHPDNFFHTLTHYGIHISHRLPLADHASPPANISGDIIIMTEKDAVKYDSSDSRLYALAITCPLPDSLINTIEKRLIAAPGPPSPSSALG